MVRSAPPRIFNLYDVVGVLVPGITLLTGFLLLFAEPPAPSELWEYLLYGIVAFSLGYVVQFWASRAVGEPKTFENTIDDVRNPRDLSGDESVSRDADSETEESAERTDGDATEAGEEGDTENADDADDSGSERTPLSNRLNFPGRVKALLCYLGYAFVGPVLWWYWSPTDPSVGSRLHANQVWKDLWATYNIDRGTDDYEELQQMIQSEVDDVRSPSRAYRFQAIRNFHRGMWISLWIVSTCLLGYVLNEWFVGIQISVIHAAQPDVPYLLQQEWRFLAVLLLGLSLPVFWHLHVEFRREFVRYLIIDYFVKLKERGGVDPEDS